MAYVWDVPGSEQRSTLRLGKGPRERIDDQGKERLAQLTVREECWTGEVSERRKIDPPGFWIALLVKKRRGVEDEGLAKLGGEVCPGSGPEGDGFHELTRTGLQLAGFQQFEHGTNPFLSGEKQGPRRRTVKQAKQWWLMDDDQRTE